MTLHNDAVSCLDYIHAPSVVGEWDEYEASCAMASTGGKQLGKEIVPVSICVCMRACERAHVPNGVPNDLRYLQSSANHHEVINPSGLSSIDRCGRARCHRWHPPGIPSRIFRQGSKWETRDTQSYTDPGDSAINTFPPKSLLPTGRHEAQIPASATVFSSFQPHDYALLQQWKSYLRHNFSLNWMSYNANN